MKQIEILGHLDDTYSIIEADVGRSELASAAELKEYLRQRGMLLREISLAMNALKLHPRRIRRWVIA